MNNISMNWELEEEKGKVITTEQVSATKQKVNVNLTPDEIRTLILKYETMYPDHTLEEFIIRTNKPGGNRVYIIRAILEEDMRKFDELFQIFNEEEVIKEREEATRLWKKLNNIPAEEEVPNNKRADKDAFEIEHLKVRNNFVLKKVNDKCANILGVVFPEDYTQKVNDNKGIVGDTTSLSLAIQILSGWSEVVSNVDVFERQANEEIAESEEGY